MAINFSQNDYVAVNTGFVQKVLPTLGCSGLKQTLASLGYLGNKPGRVAATGSLDTKSFIRVVPSDTTSPAYRGGQGLTIYFCSDAHLNNSFELANAFIEDKCTLKVKNESGVSISKGQLVYQSGYSSTEQLPLVALASAATTTTCVVLGIAVSDMTDEECGAILIEGSIGNLDTSSFSAVGDTVFLSDTLGAIAATAGTNEKVVGQIISVSATAGAFIINPIKGGNSGGSGSSSSSSGTILWSNALPDNAGATNVAAGNWFLGPDPNDLQAQEGYEGFQGALGVTAVVHLVLVSDVAPDVNDELNPYHAGITNMRYAVIANPDPPTTQRYNVFFDFAGGTPGGILTGTFKGVKWAIVVTPVMGGGG